MGGDPRVVVTTSVNPRMVGGPLFLNATSGTHIYFDKETDAGEDFSTGWLHKTPGSRWWHHCLRVTLRNQKRNYGIINLCSGETTTGQAMIDSLDWKNKARADKCWRKIKQSIHGVKSLTDYSTTYWNTRATITCHRDNIEERCDACFYYKQITKFVFII